MRKIANNPFTPRLQDPPASKLPSRPGDSSRPASSYGGLFSYPITAEEWQIMFYEKEG